MIENNVLPVFVEKQIRGEFKKCILNCNHIAGGKNANRFSFPNHSALDRSSHNYETKRQNYVIKTGWNEVTTQHKLHRSSS